MLTEIGEYADTKNIMASPEGYFFFIKRAKNW
jgi:hypothetical protein